MANQNNDIENFISWVAEQMQVDFEQAQAQLDKMSDEELLQLTEAYKKAMQTPMQKSGGKIAALVARFEPGGKVTASIEANSKAAAKAAKSNASKAPNINGATRRRVGGAVDRQGGQHMYMSEDINGNTADTFITIPAPGDTVVRQNVAINGGVSPRQYLPGTSEYESVMQRARKSSYLQGILAALRNTLGL